MSINANEVAAAADALITWFESQQLDPDDAIAVLIAVTAATIRQVAIDRGLDPIEGARVAARAMIAALKVVP